ncbi:MAG: metallophosphoesterase family protein [Myxococcota bacterium]
MLIALLSAALAGVNPNAVPTQDLYADDGETKESRENVQFAVLGDVRPAMPGETAAGRAATPDTEARIVKDISEQVQAGKVDFVLLLGDLVRESTTAEWKRFSKDWGLVLSGSELPETGTMRVRSIPVAGNHDRAGDERMVGFGAAFPGVGVDIGFGRVASWYSFDVTARGARWRFVVLDSAKDELGSRWDEQLEWIPKALSGDAYDGVLVFMHHPRWTLANGKACDEGGGPSELVDAVESSTGLGKLKAVFAGHAHTNEVYLPSGKKGEIYVVAGGGGSPADSFARWGVREDRDLKLEPIWDLAVLREFDYWVEPRKIPEAIVEKAKARGSFEGFNAEIDAHWFPVQGWWNVELDGANMHLTFRVIDHEGKLKDLYTMDYVDGDGWRIGR